MNILDRYIVRQFLLNFVILMVVLSTLFVVVNVILDVDEFIDAGRLHTDVPGGLIGGTLYAIFDFNGPLLLLLYVYFSGVVAVAAMGFTFTALARSGELVAMVASGISMYRAALWVIIVGFLLNASSLPLQEYAIPPLATKIVRGKSQVRLNSLEPFPIDFAIDRSGTLFSAAQFDHSTNTMSKVTILERSPMGMAHTRISAASAVWQDSPMGWKLTGGIAKRGDVTPTGAASQPTSQPGDPIDFISSDLSPKALVARQAAFFPRLLSIEELRKLLELDTIDKGVIIEIINSRFSLLVMNMLILVMALPYFLLREPANQLVQGVKAAVFTLGLWSGGMILLRVGADELNPVAAAWLPVVIYLPMSMFMLQRVKT